MRTKPKKKKLTARKMQRGTVGNFFVFGILALLIVLAITTVGGLPNLSPNDNDTPVNVVMPTQGPTHSALQLQTFGYVTIAPTPTPLPSEGLCQPGGVNDEPGIIAGYAPGPGQSVGTDGEIMVWVEDEGAPFIAPGQQVNTTTGAVVPNTGNLTAKAPDNFLWEPALYIAPFTAENGGAAHFPDFIKGQYSNTPPTLGNVITGFPADPVPAGQTPAQPLFGFGFNNYTAEYVWNVSDLGLTTGTYQIEFIIHDGDHDRGVGCVQVIVQ